MALFDFLKFQTKKNKDPSASLAKEQAHLRTSFFASQQLEEWNPDLLVANKGFEIYRKMLRDPQVKAAYNVFVNLLIQRDWSFILPEDTPQQQEIKEFFEFTIAQSKGTIAQSMRGILLAKAHGFSITEKVFQTVEFNGSTKWAIKELKQKPYETFFFDVDEFGNVVLIKQDIGGERIKLDPDKFIHFVNNPDLDPIWGESDLRAAHRAWWEKQNILTFWNIYLERTAGGFLTATPKDEATVLSPTERSHFDSVLRNVNQSTAMRVPAGFDVDIKSGFNTDAFEKAVGHRDRQIAKAILVPNLLGFSEQQQTGSLAQSKIQFETFQLVLNYQSDQLADVLNEQLFAQLARINFGTDIFPKFAFENRTEDQKREAANTWFEAMKSGAVANSEEDELKTRELLGYPEEVPEREDEPEEIVKPDPTKKEPEKEVEKEATKEVDNSADFIESKDPTWIQRVNFQDMETLLDVNDDIFRKDIIRNVDILHSALNSNIRESLRKNNEDKPNYQKAIKNVANAFTDEQIHKFEKDVKKNVKSIYNDGRDISRDILKSATRTLPPKERKKIKFIINHTKELATSSDDWTVADFVQNIPEETAENYFRSKGFQIAGGISEDMKKMAINILMNALENNWSTAQTVDELNLVLEPLTGKVTVDPTTGAIISDPDAERRRVETIVRTTTANVFNQSALSVYTDPDLDGFVDGLEYQAIMDTRTTAFCRNYDGFKRTLDDPIWGSITPPNHFNCRSTLVPITLADPDFKSSKLPKSGKALIQPNDGFGTVTDSDEI